MTFAEALGHFDVVVEVVETERGVGPSRTLLPQEKRPKNIVKTYLTRKQFFNTESFLTEIHDSLFSPSIEAKKYKEISRFN